VKEDASSERHGETFENESRVFAVKRNSHVEPDHDAERILHCPRKIGMSFESS
jgi:hypothetical protein